MRKALAALAAALTLGSAAIGDAADIVAPSGISVSQTVVTLTAATDTPLGANLNRKYLCLMNIGTGTVSLGFGAAAVAGAGWALDPAAGAGRQGGAMCWEAGVVVTSAVHGISTAGSTVVVLEGR